MTVLLRRLTFLVLVILLASGATTGARADDALDQYRANGTIAESYTGYLVVTSADAPAAAKTLAQQVNSKRKSVYEKRAKEQGVSAAEVGKIYSAEIFQKAPNGTYFQKPDKSFVRK
jgi:uncharacterized protein YdbL (DUF1318 family)